MNAPNPFNITTAVDYSDEEINRYWVDFMSYDKSFPQLMKTDSPMPMLILGSKGSGKTHIMRYFSFNSKKIAYQDDFASRLVEDKYIGIYLRCGGLNSSRFQGSNFSNAVWKTLFGYYIDLWFSQLLLLIVEEVIFSTNVEVDELKICNEITSNLFDNDIQFEACKSFSELRSLLRALQKQVDLEINNCSITGKTVVDVKILVSPGRLIFGMPKILERTVSIFRNFQFIFLIDEFENLLEDQQKYINTLVREREAPVTFRVGARWYGMKTYKTFSGEEDIKEGSEYEKYVIDRMFREKKDFYDQFVKEICVRRLEESGYSLASNNLTDFDFSQYYEKFNFSKYFESLAKRGDRIGHFTALKSVLKSRLKATDIQIIVSNLSFPDDLVLERTNVFIFYREWRRSRGTGLVAISEDIKNELDSWRINPDGRTATRHYIVLEKFRNDITDQLFREAQDSIPYTGFQNLVRMSVGIPRLLLITLKHIHRWSVFQGENPFRKDIVGVSAQIKGVEEASTWFLEDARIPGPNGKKVSDVISRLGQFLRELRFADTPPECSLCAFSINLNDINDNIRLVLDYLEQYSYLINVPDRIEKNSVRKFVTYQVNWLIAPKWDLPLSRRGILQLSKDEVSAIFGDDSDNFEVLRRNKINRYNAPFSDVSSGQSLFDEIDL